MYRLLIVDNEEYVVNGLIELFSNLPDVELEVYGAYSAAEALNLLMTTAMDIVITDIRMPRMTGLELQKVILQRWPYCKVIVLSGYNEFDLIQEALRNGSVNYILKTEDDEVIIESVRQAISDIESRHQLQEELNKAKLQVKQARQALQKELVESLLIGSTYGDLNEKLHELDIPLQGDRPLFVVIGKVDRWEQQYSKYDQSLILYAIQNIANEYLSLAMVHYSFIAERQQMVWLIQAKAESWMDYMELAQSIKLTSHFVYGTFEGIQTSCKQLLHVSTSFAISDQAVSWNQLQQQMEGLGRKITYSLKQQQLVLGGLADLDARRNQASEHEQAGGMQQEQIRKYCDNLTLELERKGDQYSRWLKLLLHGANEAQQHAQQWLALHIITQLLAILLEHYDKLNLRDQQELAANLKRQVAEAPFAEWTLLLEQLEQLGEHIYEAYSPAIESEENRIVVQIHHYLQQHLGGDISLKTMAYVMGHNPSYLSRLYKQKAGKSLSETINEMKLDYAKQLLHEPQHRIYDISKAVGFLSEHYFYRFFKKMTGMTPQEYREQYVKGRQ